MTGVALSSWPTDLLHELTRRLWPNSLLVLWLAGDKILQNHLNSLEQGLMLDLEISRLRSPLIPPIAFDIPSIRALRVNYKVFVPDGWVKPLDIIPAGLRKLDLRFRGAFQLLEQQIENHPQNFEQLTHLTLIDTSFEDEEYYHDFGLKNLRYLHYGIGIVFELPHSLPSQLTYLNCYIVEFSGDEQAASKLPSTMRHLDLRWETTEDDIFPDILNEGLEHLCLREVNTFVRMPSTLKILECDSMTPTLQFFQSLPPGLEHIRMESCAIEDEADIEAIWDALPKRLKVFQIGLPPLTSVATRIQGTFPNLLHE